MSAQVHLYPDGGGCAHRVRAAGRLCSVWWNAAGVVWDAEPSGFCQNPRGFKSVRKGGPVWHDLQMWVTFCRPGREAAELRGAL